MRDGLVSIARYPSQTRIKPLSESSLHKLILQARPIQRVRAHASQCPWSSASRQPVVSLPSAVNILAKPRHAGWQVRRGVTPQRSEDVLIQQTVCRSHRDAKPKCGPEAPHEASRHDSQASLDQSRSRAVSDADHAVDLVSEIRGHFVAQENTSGDFGHLHQVHLANQAAQASVTPPARVIPAPCANRPSPSTPASPSWICCECCQCCISAT